MNEKTNKNNANNAKWTHSTTVSLLQLERKKNNSTQFKFLLLLLLLPVDDFGLFEPVIMIMTIC